MLERYDLTAGQGNVYIIIDAIDECPNDPGVPSPREEVLELLGKLVRLSLPNMRLCVTSRYELDMQAVLEPISSFSISKLEKNNISATTSGRSYIQTKVCVDGERRTKNWLSRRSRNERTECQGPSCALFPITHIVYHAGLDGCPARWRF